MGQPLHDARGARRLHRPPPHAPRLGPGRRAGGTIPLTATDAQGTKEKLLRAGERLFASDGIHRVTVREINALAGQRNPSALHYHFGSRDGLVQAILSVHQASMDDELRVRLDELETQDDVGIREVVEAAVRPLARKLKTASGRDFLRILPQVLDVVSDHLRRGAALGASDQPSRTLTLLDGCIAELPRAVRQERLVAYSLTLTSLFAERALVLESGAAPALDDEQFVRHVLDVLGGVVGAPSTVTVKARRARRTT